MNWRPAGWSNPYTYQNLEAKPANTGIDFAHVPKMVAYEAGADAMLDELKKGTKERPSQPVVSMGQAGWLVFIPDE